MFDAYHKWLGIPPGADARPPNHYQLLGIARDERDAEVIESAAIRQMAYVRNFQAGAHAKECARILGELSQARLTLRDPVKRAEYDALLAPPVVTPPFTLPAATESPELVAPSLSVAVKALPLRERATGGELPKALIPLGVAAFLLVGVAFGGMKYLKGTSSPTTQTPNVVANPAPKPPKPPAAGIAPTPPVASTTAVLEILTDPPRANVSVTGMRGKWAPPDALGRLVVELPEADGKRPLTLASNLPGYREFKQILVPKPGERRALRLKLEPLEEAPPVASVATTTPDPKSLLAIRRGSNGLPLPTNVAVKPDEEAEDTPHPDPKVVSTAAVRFKETFGPIRCLAVHPEGLRAATGHEDGGLRFWSLQKGTSLKRLDGHRGAVVGMAFSSDGRRLLSGGADGLLRLWDAKSGKEMGRRPTGKTDIRAVLFGPGGLVIEAVAGQVSIIDLTNPKPLRSWDMGVGTWITGLAVSTKARLVLTGDSSGRVEVRDAESGNRTQFLPPQDGVMGAVAIDDDGRRGLSGREDGSIALWDLRTGQVLRKLKGHEGRIFGLAFAPDGRRALSSGEDGTVRLWDVKGGFETHRFEGHEGIVSCVAFTPDGKQALSGGLDKTLRLWDLPAADEAESP